MDLNQGQYRILSTRTLYLFLCFTDSTRPHVIANYSLVTLKPAGTSARSRRFDRSDHLFMSEEPTTKRSVRFDFDEPTETAWERILRDHGQLPGVIGSRAPRDTAATTTLERSVFIPRVRCHRGTELTHLLMH